MDAQHRHFDVFPKVIAADSDREIVVRPLHDHGRFIPQARWEVMAISRDEVVDRTSNDTVGARPEIRIEDGAIVIPYHFAGEQEHRFVIRGGVGDQTTLVRGEFNVYSLAADLFARRPYKGDLHLHTTHSDGKTSPAYMAARCREIGLDFFAITDHGTCAGSQEAIAAFADAPVDVRIYPGEEIHPPGNWIHMVNFGGRLSVSDLIRQDEDAYRAQVRAIEEALDDLEGLERHQYASCKWCYDRVRDGGGLAILCHPYWNYWHAYSVSETEQARHFGEWPCDALELIGGYELNEVECNMLQVARYHQERAAHGREFPIVGASDAHIPSEDHLFGWYYTIVFSPSLELADLIDSIKAGCSVAVEALPGRPPRVHGPYRMVKFAYFALREMFSAHDELCAEEGRLMRAYTATEPAATTQLQSLSGRTAALMDHFWA